MSLTGDCQRTLIIQLPCKVFSAGSAVCNLCRKCAYSGSWHRAETAADQSRRTKQRNNIFFISLPPFFQMVKKIITYSTDSLQITIYFKHIVIAIIQYYFLKVNGVSVNWFFSIFYTNRRYFFMEYLRIWTIFVTMLILDCFGLLSILGSYYS